MKLFISILLLFGTFFNNRFVYGGVIGKIGDPILLPNVKYKILVLEFDNPEGSTWGRDISQMIAQEILGNMRGVFNLGVVHLHQPDKHVDYTPENIDSIAKTQKALVVIWGEFYTDSMNVYLHSHLKIIPQDSFPESGLGLSFRLEGEEMTAKPPTLQVNFRPITLSIETLRHMHEFYNQTINLRDNPNDTARIKGQLKPGSAYFIKKREGDWIRLIVINGPDGWIKYNTLGYQNELNEAKGLLLLAQGTIQYMANSYNEAVNSFTDYVNVFSENQDNMNQCFSHILLGTALLRQAKYKEHIPSDEGVSYEYQKASEYLPDNASPVNFLAIMITYKYYDKHNMDESSKKAAFTVISDVENRLIHVIQTENNLDAVKNLKILYMNLGETNLLQGDLDSYEYRNLLKQRMDALDNIIAKLKATN